jgi:WD40 repeat protein
MAPDLPDGFVQRPEEFDRIRRHLVDSTTDDVAPKTVVIHGPGGFGKTTLAIAVCHDDKVNTSFFDGILWVTIGERPTGFESLIELYAALTGERPGFVNQEDAVVELAKRTAEVHCLVVIDDVWNAAHLRPLLRATKGCTRLITTRHFQIAVGAQAVEINEMSTSQAVEMLTAGLDHSGNVMPFYRMAEGMGRWPLMLELLRGALRSRMARGDRLERAIRYLESRFDQVGAGAFDQRNPIDRNQAIGRTVEVSLGFLTSEERKLLIELSIFPSDADIPLTIVRSLWELDEFQTEDVVANLANLSLIKFDLDRGTIRLHTVLRAYLLEHQDDPASLHAKLVDLWGDPRSLKENYSWRYIGFHLVHAGRIDRLRELLLDYDWLRSKLEACDVSALIEDFDLVPDDVDVWLIQGAVRLSAHILSQVKSQLATQLLGRLLFSESPRIQTMLRRAERSSRRPWLHPLESSLTRPGGPLLRTIQQTGPINALAVTASGRRVIADSGDRTLTIWDLETGMELHTLKGHGEPITALVITPDARRAFSASNDQTVRVWDLDRKAEIIALRGHKDRVWAVAMLSNGRQAISGSEDHMLILWDVESGTPLRTMTGHGDVVTGVAVIGNGQRAISSSGDYTLKVWDLETGSELNTLRGHTWHVNAVAVMPDGKLAVSGSGDYTVRIWDLDTGTERNTLSRHTGVVRAVAVSPDGRKVISGSADFTVKIWDVETGVELQTLIGHAGAITSLAITPDGKRLVSGSWDSSLKVWDLESAGESRRLPGHDVVITAVAVDRGGRRAVSGSTDRSLKVWDLASGEEILTLEGHTDTITCVAMVPNEDWVISSSVDQTIRIWDLRTGELLRILRGHTWDVNSVAVTEDGRFIISGSGDHTVKVWEIESGREVRTFEGHDDWVRAVAVSSEGRAVISGSDDRTLRIWDFETGAEIRRLEGHADTVTALAVAAGGQQVVSGYADGQLKVWDLKSGRELLAVRGHARAIESVYAFRSRAVAITGSSDLALKVWDLTSGQAIAVFMGDAPILACSGDETTAVIAAGDRLGRLHRLRLEEALSDRSAGISA